MLYEIIDVCVDIYVHMCIHEFMHSYTLRVLKHAHYNSCDYRVGCGVLSSAFFSVLELFKGDNSFSLKG